MASPDMTPNSMPDAPEARAPRTGAFLARGGQIAWVDLAKGVGILLVVFGHAWRGVAEAGLIQDQALFQAVDRLIYTFHMPLFFFLSGLFLEPALGRQSWPKFAWARVQRLVWPLILWTWIFFGFKALGGGAVNDPLADGGFPLLPLPPQLHMWFLWALFLIHLTLAASAGLFARFADRAVFWAGALGVGFLLVLTPVQDTPLQPWIFEALQNAVFVLLGMAAARFRGWPSGGRLMAVTLAAALLFCGGLFVALQDPPGLLRHALLSAGVMLSFVVLLRALARGLGRSALARALEGLGTYSLAIYLAHTIFSAATRIALQRVGIDGLAPHLVLGVLAGLIFPLALALVSRRLRLDRVLGLSAG
jgi:fucose 4-O-acetylase-like acetyltransferase